MSDFKIYPTEPNPPRHLKIDIYGSMEQDRCAYAWESKEPKIDIYIWINGTGIDMLMFGNFTVSWQSICRFKQCNMLGEALDVCHT